MRRSSASSNSSSGGSSAAVRPVTLSVAATVPPTALTFHRLPHAGPGDKLELADPLGGIGIVTNASIDEMREILDVLNADDADAQRRAADEAAEKRRKHREAMVLFRLRKKMNFGDMKKQEQSLQDVLQLKLREYRQLRDRRSSVHSNPHDDATLRKLQDEFADILTVKESLLRENRAMEGVINELAKFQKLVMDEAERQAEDDQHSSASTESSPRKPTSQDTTKPAVGGGEWIQLLENESPIYYVPESDASMEKLSQASFARSQKLYEDFIAERFEVTETYCLGWRAQHSLMWTPDKKRVLRFRFTRQVPRWFMKLDDYRRLAWPAVTTPELNARLYSTPVHVKVLQWSGENTFITLRNSPHRDRKVHIRYFASNAQVEFRDEQNRRAYMIHHSILDREPLAQPAPGQQPIVWIKEGTQCMKFTEIEENDTIEIDHCGYMNCPSEEQARYLMVETCSILMRWEQMVVPPRLLTSD